MLVEALKDLVKRMRDDDEVVILMCDYEEVRDRAEERGFALSRAQWKQIVREVNRSFDNRRLLDFIDQRVSERAHRMVEEDYGECECDECL
jgi:deoxyadenosine/deoxycytidine kinase